MNRLMLCAGASRRDGWKTLDANPKHEPDFLATIPPLPDSVKAVAWDEIEWIHGITSFYPWEGAQILKELKAVLVPGGKLILEQPDFNKVGQRPEWIFGDPSLTNPLHMNKWAYTPATLTAAMHKAGFSIIAIRVALHHLPERDFRIEAFA